MPMTEILTTSAELLMSKWPMSVLRLLQDLERARQLGRLHREGHVGVLAVRRDVLHDHVDVDVGVGQRPEDARGDARLVLDLEEGDLGLVLGVGDAADDLLFHDLILVANDGSDIFEIVEPARAVMASGATKLDSTRVLHPVAPWRARPSASAAPSSPSDAISSISS